jgi:hypothetical protein
MSITFKEWSDVNKLASAGKIDIKGLSVADLKKGLSVEKEHTGKMGKDTKVINSELDALKIAVAHMREDKDYYKKLSKAGL